MADEQHQATRTVLDMFPSLRDWNTMTDEVVRTLLGILSSTKVCFDCKKDLGEDRYMFRNPMEPTQLFIGHEHEVKYATMLSDLTFSSVSDVTSVFESELAHREEVRKQYREDRAAFDHRNRELAGKLFNKPAEKVTKEDLQRIFKQDRLDAAWKEFRAERLRQRTTNPEPLKEEITQSTSSLAAPPRMVNSQPRQKRDRHEAAQTRPNGEVMDASAIQDKAQKGDMRLIAN